MRETLFTTDAPDCAPPAHHAAPVGTSDAAAASIAPTAAHLRGVVLAYIASCGERGATDEEGQRATGMGGNTYRPRRGELVRARLVAESAARRATASGRMAAVWVAVKGVDDGH